MIDNNLYYIFQNRDKSEILVDLISCRDLLDVRSYLNRKGQNRHPVGAGIY